MIGRQGYTPAARRSGQGTVTRLLVYIAGVATVSALAMSPQPAHALFEGNGLYVKGVGAQSVGGFWLGAYTAPHNVETRYPVWCTHMWRANPKPQDTASISDLGESKRWGPDEIDLSTAQMAWLLDRYQGDRHPENRAVLSFLIHANFEGDQAGKNTQDSVNTLVDRIREQLPQVYEKAKDYVRQAQKAAVTTYENGSVESRTPRNGFLKDLGVKNEKGEWIPGLKLKLMLIGPARFTSTGTSQWEGTTQETGVSLEWEATGNGSVKWEGTYVNPVRTTLTRYGVRAATQDTASYGNRPDGDKEEKRLKGGAWKVLMDFQPMLRSKVEEETITGHHLSDTITAFADPNYGDGSWLHDDHGPIPVAFDGIAYDLGEEPPSSPVDGRLIPQDAPVIGYASAVFTGEGTKTVTIDVPESAHKPGFVSWVWKVRKDHQGQYAPFIHSDWSDQLALSTETSVTPWKVQIYSAAQVKETRGGTYLIDDLWVSGFPQSHPGWAGREPFGADVPTMRHRLLFFPQGLEVAEENRDKAEEIGSIEIPARNGYYPSLGDLTFRVEPERVGTYVFTTEFDGDSRVTAYRSPVDDPNEQYTRKQSGPITISTHARDGADSDQIVAGAGPVSIVDSVCYEGVEAGGEYALNATLVDRETGVPLSNEQGLVSARTEFRAESTKGCSEVVFRVQGEQLRGKQLVVFEDLYQGNERVAFHRDINSREQSVKGEEPKKPHMARTGGVTNSLAAMGVLLAGIGLAAHRVSRRCDS